MASNGGANKGKKYKRHKEGGNSTKGWSPEARAKAAERMKRLRSSPDWKNHKRGRYRVSKEAREKKAEMMRQRHGNITGKNTPAYQVRQYRKKTGHNPDWYDKELERRKKERKKARAQAKKKPVGRPKTYWTKEKRAEASKRTKEWWANLPPEEKEWRRQRLSSNKRSWDDYSEEAKKAILAGLDKGRKKIDYHALGKKAWANRSEEDKQKVREHLSRISKEWWASLSDYERAAAIERMQSKQRRLSPKERKEKSSYRSKVYYQEQQRLYLMAKQAMAHTGTEPLKNRSLGYYRNLIEFFDPELVDWEIY